MGFDIVKIKGVVHHVGATEEIGANGFAKRLLVVCDDPASQYPRYAAIEAKRGKMGDKTRLLDGLLKGEEVAAVCAPESRQWKDRWFTSLTLLALTRSITPQATDAAQTAEIAESDPGDLPF